MKRPTIRVCLVDNVQWERTVILAGTVIVAPEDFAAPLLESGQAVAVPSFQPVTLNGVAES